MQFRKCYNVRCYRITLRGQCAKDPNKNNIKHQPSHPQTNQFHNPCRPANSAFPNKPQKTNRLFNPHNITCTPINYNTYSHNPIILPYSHSWTSSSFNPNSQQPSSQDTIWVGSTIPYNHPPTLHNITTRMISQLQKSNRIHMINFVFYSKK